MLTVAIVWIKIGICTADSLINLALCCLGYVPGLLHAWYIIARHPENDYESIGDSEGARVTYYYVAQGPAPSEQSQEGYGGTSNRERMEVPHATKPRSPQPQQQSGSAAANGSTEGESSSGQAKAPPTYAEAVKGDHKVQTQD